MKKNRNSFYSEELKKIFFMMKLTFYLLVFGFVQMSANTLAQVTVNLNSKNLSLHQLIWELEKQTDFDFVYSTADVEAVKLKEVVAENESVETLLNKVLLNTDLVYEFHNGVVVIKSAPESKNMKQQPREIVVRGIIKDDRGDTLSGVSVSLKGTAGSGAISDVNGKYEIKIPAKAGNVLVFSYIGMQKKEITVPDSGGNLDIIMHEDQKMLEEVVVTGYGSLKKSAYAGSASVFKTEKIEDVPVLSMNDLLVGNASGVTVSSGTNQPGSPSAIRIRGMGSMNASKSPLYVIDGVPALSGDLSAVSLISEDVPGTDIMSTINTSDIENIAVIKDAAAASLYGSRAANGVILITTKSGKKGKPVFTLKADAGFSDFAMDYRTVMDGQQRRDLMMEGLYNKRILTIDPVTKLPYTPAQAQAYAESNIDAYAPVPWCGFVNWDDVLFKRGTYQNYEASASGGGENTRIYSSLGYTDQQGTTQNSGLKRITGRFSIDWNATKKFTLGLKTLFSNIHQDVFSEGSTYTSPFYSSRNAVVPSDPVYLEDGSYNRSFIRNSDRNPKLAMDYNYKREALTRAFNTLYVQYEIIKDLKFKSTFSYDYSLSKGDSWDDPRTSDGRNSNGTHNKRMYEYRKWIFSNSLNYNTRFGEKHFIDATLAYDLESYGLDYLAASTKNFAEPTLNAISNGAENSSISGYPSAWRMVSLISRADYNYAARYYLGASLRYDGTSRLSGVDNSRWGSFWSVSGAWRASEEAFMESCKDVLSDLRIRISYGSNGTLPSDYYGYYGLSSLGYSYIGSPGIRAFQIENLNLQWESNYNLSLGIDIGLFRHRINLTIEPYIRRSNNLLYDYPISYTTGFNTYLKNIGELKNTGVDMELNSINIENKEFRWSTNLNIGFNKNELMKLDGISTEQVSGHFIHKIGMPYNTYYLIEFAGIDPKDGEPQFYKNTMNEDGSLNKETTKNPAEAQRIAYKNFEPKLTGGLTNSLSYKWFDLNFMFTCSFGGYSYDNGAQKSEHGGSDMKANVPVYYNNRWQKEGDIRSYERFVADRAVTMASITNTRRIHSSDFLRLKNLTFGFRVPRNWTKAIGADQLRVYCSGNNLWTWAQWKGYDPESVQENGDVGWEQPPLRTWTFGIELKF